MLKGNKKEVEFYSKYSKVHHLEKLIEDRRRPRANINFIIPVMIANIVGIIITLLMM